MYTSGLGNDASVTQHFATIQWIRIVENCMECSALQVSITIVLDFPTVSLKLRAHCEDNTLLYS